MIGGFSWLVQLVIDGSPKMAMIYLENILYKIGMKYSDGGILIGCLI